MTVSPVAEPAACRICNSPQIKLVGRVEYYAGFKWPICYCAACGCRFTNHENAVYDRLHAEENSSYVRYRELAARCEEFFNSGDLEGLKYELGNTSKYKFVIDQSKDLPEGSRILEVGCARGFLTSYFILAGHKITGGDVSPDAISSARAAFGDYFVLAESPTIAAGAPYKIIYHVGTIGCVADPVGMTQKLLSMLEPGGRLLFNAPNRDALLFRDQLWFDSAPPPDVVTLFPPDFWSKRFSDVAEVHEQIEMSNADKNLIISLRKALGRRWKKPVPLAMSESHKTFAPPPRASDKFWRLFERGVRKIGCVTNLSRLAPAWPTEYGLFVSMTRK